MQAFAEFAYLSLIKGHCNDIITVREASEMVTAEEDRDGYANRYLLDLQGLKMLDLSQKGFTTLHWITLLLQNRVFTLKNDIIKAGKRYSSNISLSRSMRMT